METMEVSTDDLIKSVTDVEKLGDEIVADRHSIVDMDRIRNKNREALGCLKRPSDLTAKEEFVWMNIGDLLIRSTKENLIGILEKDQKYLDDEIDKTRKGLKPKVANMERSLGKPELKGFDLKPLSKEESQFIHQAMNSKF